jgi:hypothetical protein
MDAAAVHRLCVLELADLDDALAASAAALAAVPATGELVEEPQAERLRVVRLTRTAIAARRRRRLCGRLLRRRRAASGHRYDLLAGLRGRARTVLALELGAGLDAAAVAEVLDVGEMAVLAARRHAVRRLHRAGGLEALRRRVAELTAPEELPRRVQGALAARRRRERLDPRRLLATGPLPRLAVAALVAAVAGGMGASAGLLGQHPRAHLPGGPTGRVPAAGPPARAFAAAGYDPARGETVLFGGRAAENRLLDDTWSWDGAAWHQHHPVLSPSPRKAAAMAWDPTSRRLLLFGGDGMATPGLPGTELRDTWAWDGEAWTPLHPAVSPPGRLGADTAALGTDEATGELLLVGDGTTRGTPCALTTWRWSGRDWTELRPPTAPRAAVTGRLAYAPGTGGLVLVTALPTASACGGVAATAAVWTWDGTAWAEQHPVTELSAKQLVDGQLSSSAAGVLVPGYHTFSWDGADWHDAGADGPGARFGAAIAFDGGRRQSVLFGGCCIVGGRAESVYDDTWTWDGQGWLRRGGSHPAAEPATAATPPSPWVGSVLPLGSVDAVALDPDALYAVVERLQLGVWDLDRAMVARLDRATGRVTLGGPFPAADSLALAGGKLWVGAGLHPGIANPGRQALYALDPATLQVENELSLQPPPDATQFSARLAGTEKLLWLGWGADLIRIDPGSASVLRRLDQGAGTGVDDVVVDPAGDRMYVSTRLPSGDALITARDPVSGATSASATEHSTAGARLAAAGDGVWITFPTGLSSGLSHRRATDLGALGLAAATGGGLPSGNTLRAFLVDGLLWLADAQRSTLSCADPRTGAVRATAGIARAGELAGDAAGIYLGATDGVVVIGLDPRCAG